MTDVHAQITNTSIWKSRPPLSVFPIDSEQNLHSFLSQWDRKVVPVAADGNCLFWAVSHLLFHNENAHWPLWDLIIRFENLNSSIFERRMTSINATTFAGHIRKLCHPNTWATHIEVLAIATYFQVPVYFCTHPPQPSTGGTYWWVCCNPITSSEVLWYPILTEPFFEGANSVRHLELAVSSHGVNSHESNPHMVNFH